jgi:autotransporter-associated beta strand protein
MKEQKKGRRGSVTIMVCACLIGMLSFVALAIDGGLLMDNRQQVQSAADAAALAAAEDLYLNWNYNQGLDPNGTAKAAALASAAANGYSSPAPVVNIPPLSGPFTGLPGYAEVIITYSQQRYFSRVFGSAPVTIQARAVAEGGWKAPKVGVLVLNPTAPGALTDTGGGTMTVTGTAPLIVDSSDPAAATITGGGTVTATEFDITGSPGVSGSGTWIGTINSPVPPTPDPLAYLPEPDPSTMTVQSTNNFHLSNNETATINPGVYVRGITVTGSASLTMNPGIYYMQGGGFTFSGQGNLTAVGVMIFNEPGSNSDVISIGGSGTITLSPPTSGLYQGISIFQERSSPNTVSVSGNGTSSYTGTFYVAGGTLSVTGNGASNVIGAQYISNNLVVNGGGGFSVNWNPNQVGRTRVLRLVE